MNWWQPCIHSCEHSSHVWWASFANITSCEPGILFEPSIIHVSLTEGSHKKYQAQTKDHMAYEKLIALYQPFFVRHVIICMSLDCSCEPGIFMWACYHAYEPYHVSLNQEGNSKINATLLHAINLFLWAIQSSIWGWNFYASLPPCMWALHTIQPFFKNDYNSLFF